MLDVCGKDVYLPVVLHPAFDVDGCDETERTCGSQVEQVIALDFDAENALR